MARYGFAVTGFDISSKAVAWCKERFPESSVTYVTADLLEPPTGWAGIFYLVLEIYTL